MSQKKKKHTHTHIYTNSIKYEGKFNILVTKLKGLSQEGDLGESSSSSMTSLPAAIERDKREKRTARHRLREGDAIAGQSEEFLENLLAFVSNSDGEKVR